MDNNKDNAKKVKFQDALIDEKDFLKNIVQKFCQDILEEEMKTHLGAAKYERSAQRCGQRNGYKPRTLKTRVGTLNLLVPQDREGNFSTELFGRYRRAEKALVLTLMEMYLKGVSTRKVSSITEKLCGSSFSSSTVSSLTSNLDASIKAWNNRPLKKEYPYIFADATYLRSRIENSIISHAMVIITGIDEEGLRQVLAVEPIHTETYEAYDAVFSLLKARGLSGVKLLISDDNKGLKKAARKAFLGCFWQRCCFHFNRNVLDIVPRSLRRALSEDLKAVFTCSSKEDALSLAKAVSAKYPRYGRLEEMLTVDILDALSFMDFPIEHRRRIRTVNMIERLNGEIKRRTNVVRIFPNIKSAERLVCAIAMEINEERVSSRGYLEME
jgi:putative transposase